MAVRSLAVVVLALVAAQVSAQDCGCFNPLLGGGVSAAAAAAGGFLAAPAADFYAAPSAGLLAAPGSLDALLAAGPAAGLAYGAVAPGLEESCCPGPVIEKKTVVTKPITVPYSYSVPTFSKKCFQNTNIDRKVVPSSTVSQQCNNQITTVKVPTTDITTAQQPLCKRTCTTSEYVIQIPIVQTTCTSSPLCKQTVRAQPNVITTVAAKTSCNQQTCTSNNVIQTPVYQTVCQNYQGAINKVGAKTVLKPEIKKSCVQLPPYKCLKPASAPAALSFADAGALAGLGALPAAGLLPAGLPFSGAGALAGLTLPALSAAPVDYSYAGALPAPAPVDLSYAGALPAPAPVDLSFAAPAPAILPGGCSCNC